MNRWKIITIVALIAAILWVIAIADGARVELAKGDARLQFLTGETQRLSAWLKEASDPAANRRPDDLAKLRGEIASLRDLTNSLAKMLAERTQNQPARAALKHGPDYYPGSGTVVSDSGSPQYREQLYKDSMDWKLHPETGDARNLRQAVWGYERDHNGVFPGNLQVVAPYAYQGNLPLAGTQKGRDTLAGVGEFDLLFQGSLDDLAGVPTQSVALLRQQQAWPTPSGKSAKIYVMVGGKVQVVESDDNFQSWEAEHVVPGLEAGQ